MAASGHCSAEEQSRPTPDVTIHQARIRQWFRLERGLKRPAASSVFFCASKIRPASAFSVVARGFSLQPLSRLDLGRDHISATEGKICLSKIFGL
jgi:hypothetical protein